MPDDRWRSGFTISAGAPYDTAKLFLSVSCVAGDRPTMFYHRDGFYFWDGAAYLELGAADLRASLYSFTAGCVAFDKSGKDQPFNPNKNKIANVIESLAAAANLSSAIAAPAWLDQSDLGPVDIIVCRNGLLHVPSRTLLPHTPRFFCHNALDFDYEPDALPPTLWLEFLDQLWRDDTESIDTLQEIMGLMLTAETRHQKAFLLVGPKRSGKGTIARVLVGLVGKPNCVSPTLASLGTNFGLAPLINKRLAIISDARLGAKADQHAIAEAVLRITGEDSVSIDRTLAPMRNCRHVTG